MSKKYEKIICVLIASIAWVVGSAIPGGMLIQMRRILGDAFFNALNHMLMK